MVFVGSFVFGIRLDEEMQDTSVCDQDNSFRDPDNCSGLPVVGRRLAFNPSPREALKNFKRLFGLLIPHPGKPSVQNCHKTVDKFLLPSLPASMNTFFVLSSNWPYVKHPCIWIGSIELLCLNS